MILMKSFQRVVDEVVENTSFSHQIIGADISAEYVKLLPPMHGMRYWQVSYRSKIKNGRICSTGRRRIGCF